MKVQDIIHSRIFNQQLAKSTFSSVGEIVKWLGAVQAQDYLGSLWSIGQRLEESSELQIEKAIHDREIIRTWPMRGTLHFVSPDDARWMLALLAPRVMKRAKTRYEQLGLDTKTFAKSRKVFERVLGHDRALTRTDLYDALSKAKVNIEGERGIHLINHAAQEGLICLGPRSGKQHTFVLLDEWVPKSRNLGKDEAVAELTRRYFTSHGPATAQDFSWWSGLTLSEVEKGLAENKNMLVNEKIGKIEYWFAPQTASGKLKSPHCCLLSWFDEYIISYKDRSAAFDPDTEKFIEKPKNGLYTPIIVINGKIAGTWKRTIEKKNIHVETYVFRNFSPTEVTALNREVKRYKSFLASADAS
jgi:hypothetical protein